MKTLAIPFLINSFIALSVQAQDYLKYNTPDSSQIMKDINTLLTYRKVDDFKAEEPDVSLAYSKDKKDRIKYDSLNKAGRKRYFKGKAYRRNRSWALGGLLANQFFYKELKTYQDQLIPSIWYDYSQKIEPRWKQRKVLSLLDISDSKRDSLLQDKGTPLAVRARLGDQEAEQKIIERFNTAFTDVESPYFKEGDDLAENLLYIGSETSLDAFFEMLDSDRVYYYEYSCNVGKCWYDRAVAADLLWVLKEYHPISLFTDLPKELVGESIGAAKEHPKNPGEYYWDFYSDRNMQSYYRAVEKLVKKLYNREVTINPPYWERDVGPALEELYLDINEDK